VAIRSQPDILARGDDPSASLTDLTGGVRLVAFRVEVFDLRILPLAGLDLALQAPVVRRPFALDLLPHSFFLAVLGLCRHRCPLCVRSCRSAIAGRFARDPSLALVQRAARPGQADI
jgi:hypothetical protein